MKVNVFLSKTVRVKEGKRYLMLEFLENECKGFDSNLPYQKSLDDWKFFHKALGKILKEMRI